MYNDTIIYSTIESDFIPKVLRSLSSSNLSYNSSRNCFLTEAYTSAAGNTYFQCFKVGDNFAASFDIGVGTYYIFLNGITVYAYDGNNSYIIGKKTWGGCGNWCEYSDSFAREQISIMLCDFLMGKAKQRGSNISSREISSYVNGLLDSMDSKKYITR